VTFETDERIFAVGMNDQQKPDVELLRGQLAEAHSRKVAIEAELRSFAANIAEHRKSPGNPYYYGGITDRTEESIAQYTGYASADPGFQLRRDYRESCRDLNAVREQLRAAGVEAD
jgi:hypothetical protein